VVSVIVGGLISLIITWFLQFFLHSVDYTKAEKVQFEDDEYYYYVKAVPKIKVNIQKNKKTANAERIRERNIAREHMIENGMAERVKDLPDDDVEFVED
jgi:hypothetical protein